jgi:hypothetical protein
MVRLKIFAETMYTIDSILHRPVFLSNLLLLCHNAVPTLVPYIMALEYTPLDDMDV